MKKYRCIPIAIELPIVFSAFTLFWIYIAFFSDSNWVNSSGEPDPLGGLILCSCFISICLVMVIVTLIPSVRRVEIYGDRLLCKGLFAWNAFSLEFDKCYLGMDYHVQNGGKIWWIYLCYGAPPKYKPGNPANRINSLKIKPGFVKIMYSEEVYQALIEVLPKKQRTGLETARRCAGFDKQGRII